MGASREFLITGFDPTGDPDTCITRAQLLQMINAAYLMPDLGGFVWQQTAPNVITFPELARYVWMELDGSDIPTGNMFYYNGTSWNQLVQPIPDNSITLDKLTLTGTAPYVIIQMNSAGTAWAFVSPVAAIQNGTLPLAKLISSTNGKFIYYTGGSWTATTLDNTFLNTIITALEVANLAPGTPGQVLMTTAGPTVAWGTFSTGLPVITGVGDALKLIQVNAAGAAYELIARAALPIAIAQLTGGTNGNFSRWSGGGAVWSGGTAALVQNPAPATATNTPLGPHGLTGLPDAIVGLAKCLTTDAGYAVGDVVPLDSIVTSSGGFDWPAYTIQVDATNVSIVSGTLPGSGKYLISTKSTGALTDFTQAKWEILVNLIKL